MCDYYSRSARPRSHSQRRIYRPSEFIEVPRATVRRSKAYPWDLGQLEQEIQEIDCSYRYDDCEDCSKEKDLADLQEAFTLGANSLRQGFDEAMQRLTSVFNTKFDNYTR